MAPGKRSLGGIDANEANSMAPFDAECLSGEDLDNFCFATHGESFALGHGPKACAVLLKTFSIGPNIGLPTELAALKEKKEP